MAIHTYIYMYIHWLQDTVSSMIHRVLIYEVMQSLYHQQSEARKRHQMHVQTKRLGANGRIQGLNRVDWELPDSLLESKRSPLDEFRVFTAETLLQLMLLGFAKVLISVFCLVMFCRSGIRGYTGVL